MKPETNTTEATAPPNDPETGQICGAAFCSLQWHLLNAITLEGVPLEVMAAASDDGIGVIAHWTRNENGGFTVRAMDTEGLGMELVTDFGEEECVPSEPPFTFKENVPAHPIRPTQRTSD